MDASADLLWSSTTNWRAECRRSACSVREEGCCLNGLPHLSPGFQPRFEPWEGSATRRRALKGAQEKIRIRCSLDRNHIRLLAIPNLPPFQGGSVLLGVFPGLKPWAESCRPFGTSLPAYSITPLFHHSTTPIRRHALNYSLQWRLANIQAVPC
jgi:hypothetical protein